MVDNISFVASHELAEAVTDPAVGVTPDQGDTPVYPMGWYDANDYNGEISDICLFDQTTVTGANGKDVVVSKNWSNEDNKCI